MKITAIVGSPRAEGNTSYLVDQALQEAAAHGLETEKIILSQHQVNPCMGHENCASFPVCQQKDDTPWILDKFSSAEGIILGSPVYYYSVSAQMKAFIDRNYFLYNHGIPLRALCAGLIVAAGGGGTEQTARVLQRFLKISSGIPDDRIITLTGYASKPGEARNNLTLVEKARRLGSQMSEMLVAAHNPKIA